MHATNHYRHWRDVPREAWHWPNFLPEEIACRGTGSLVIHEFALGQLQSLRDRLGKPMIVRSAYRSPEHNRAVGGAPNSKHLDGMAFDISMANQDPEVFERTARAVGFQGFGFYPEPRNNFMHIDMGPRREWGTRWPSGAPEFSPEPQAQKPLAQSRTMRGGGAAGFAAVGVAGIEVIQSALADAQTTIQPLVPYLDNMRWLLILIALAGVGVTIYARHDDWQKGRR